MTRLLPFMVPLAMLSACAPDPQSRYYPTQSQQYFQDFFGPRYMATVPPIYCYATIGDPDCYAVPVVGWENRLIAQYGPRPY